MGNDGGSIPRRDELVRVKKKPGQKDRDSEREYKWKHCHLTQEPLGKRIVACQLGRVYNKEAVIERLLDKTTPMPPSCAHIKSIKDIKELEVTPNPSYDRAGSSKGDGGAYTDRQVSPWICPVTGVEMSGKFKFVFDWSNGKVLSERAHKMVRNDDATKISEENLIVMNPDSKDEQDWMKTKMEGRKAREKALKKAKKDLKRAQEGTSEPTPSTSSSIDKTMKKPKIVEKIVEKIDEKKKKLSIQDDKTKSEVFKSLFSTHKTAVNQPKGNWVTFDPRYN